MDEQSGKNVFIIGSGEASYTLAQKLSELEEVSEIFVAPGNDAMKEFSTVVDIRENSIQELLEFALENAIDLTIVQSETAIKNDISGVFQSHNQMLFAPTKQSANICIDKIAGKKFMYKSGILCPKFATFDRPQLAIDYVKKANMPVVIKTEEHQPNGVLVCNSFQIAKSFIDDLFEKGEKRVLIEDYIYGHEFSFYVITDGYHALSLGSVATYKSELDGNGGVLTEGMGCITPDYKVSKNIEQQIMAQIVYPTLNSLAHHHTPYVGVLGIDLILTEEGQLFAIEFNPFLKTPDQQGILALLNENLYNLFQACVVGSFADDYNTIDIADSYAASCLLAGRKEGVIIEGIDELDSDTSVAHLNTHKNKYLEYEATGLRPIVLTRTARVLSKAITDLYEEVSVVKFDGMKFRKDIGKI